MEWVYEVEVYGEVEEEEGDWSGFIKVMCYG